MREDGGRRSPEDPAAPSFTTPSSSSSTSPTTSARSSPLLSRDLRAPVQPHEAGDAEASAQAHRTHSNPSLSAYHVLSAHTSSPPSTSSAMGGGREPPSPIGGGGEASSCAAATSPPDVVCEPGHRMNTVPSVARYGLRSVAASGVHAAVLSAV